MENNQNKPENNQEENTNQNANSAYSGSGSMQPGAGTGETGRLNDYSEKGQKERDQHSEDKPKKTATTGKSMSQATDPSKLSDI